MLAVEQDVPGEQRETYLRVQPHILFKVDDIAVIECAQYAYLLEAVGIAFEVLDCVGVRVQYVGVLNQLL